MDKQLLRQEMMARRQALEGAERQRLSQAAQAHLIASEWFDRAGLILLYQPMRGETETSLVAAAALKAGKRLALPRVVKSPRGLTLYAYAGDPGALAPGAYGILEPDPGWAQVGPGEVGLAVVPGVAFDRHGHRLGYGGGFYDRTLPLVRSANPAAVLVGLAYEFQVVPALPRDPHDIPVDGLATERGLLRF